jgi:hypothetical protein
MPTRLLFAAFVLLACLVASAPAATPPRRFPSGLAWSAGILEDLVPAGTGLGLAPGKSQGTFTSPAIDLSRRYDRIVASWNSRTADGSWVQIEVRPFRGDTPVSDWLTLATWSRNARGARDTGAGEVTVDQDTLKVQGGADRVRLRATLKQGTAAVAPKLAALGVTAFQSSEHPATSISSVAGGTLKIPVPYRSQRDANPAISGRCCGPTSLSMALQFEGVNLKTDDVAALAKDPPGEIQFGNWAYLAATAGELGMDTEVRAMASLDDVIAELKAGNPVILAIQFGPGELPGAPISKTGGHLILARGFDASGNIFVNDPAGHGAADGQIKYARVPLVHAWKRGIGIVIRKGADACIVPDEAGLGE